MELADQETGVPTIMQGEKGAAPDTVGGMQMLMNSANVVLRRLVKQFDDMVTRPHIRRYYDYNMLYGEDEEIKGDFSVDARGSSALMVRAPAHYAMDFNPVSLKMNACLGWTPEALQRECDYVADRARAEGGRAGEYFWIFPPPGEPY